MSSHSEGTLMLHVQEVHIHVCAKAARGGQGRTKDVQGHSRAQKM